MAERAGLEVPAVDGFEVVERVPGTANTDFGALGDPPKADLAPLGRARASGLPASWPPRGPSWTMSGRGRPPSCARARGAAAATATRWWRTSLNAEAAYVRKLGVTARAAAHNRMPEVTWREELLGLLRDARSGEPVTERGWPPRYAARRIAWHVLDHAWEIEDKSEG